MTKTQLAQKFLTYPQDARIDITWANGNAVDSIEIKVLQEIVGEWNAANLEYLTAHGFGLIFEPDASVLPDFNS